MSVHEAGSPFARKHVHQQWQMLKYPATSAGAEDRRGILDSFPQWSDPWCAAMEDSFLPSNKDLTRSPSLQYQRTSFDCRGAGANDRNRLVAKLAVI